MGGQISFPKIPLSKDKVVIVTGANSGIGYATAKAIAVLGATVIIACRSKQRAMEAINRMKSEFQVEKEKGRDEVKHTDELSVEFMELDLTSLISTKAFVDTFKESGRKLNILICNAGIALVPLEFTEDGYEKQFQVNYLSQLLLSFELIPIMKQSGDDSRIVLVSSLGHKLHSTPFSIENISAKNYGRYEYYGNSKLYQIMQMYFMNRRLSDTSVTITSLHPGVIDTGLSRGYQDASFFAGLFKSPDQGAVPSINAAINSDYKGARDIYFDAGTPGNPHTTARNERHQEDLLKFSLQCLKDYLSDKIKNEWMPKE